jgi:hypothetical protein
MTGKRPWKPHPMARTCQWCKSQRPGMQPLTLVLPDGTKQRGYWHLPCFEKERAKIKKATHRAAEFGRS